MEDCAAWRSVSRGFARAGAFALDAVFPANCGVCQAQLAGFSRVPVCPACLASAEAFLPEFHCRQCRTPFANRFPLNDEGVCRLCLGGGNRFDAAYTYGAYEGNLRDLVHLLKYQGVQSLAKPLARHLAEALPREQRFDCIVPVPMHWLRRLSRGFDHAELLARELAARTGIPAEVLLVRKRRTPPQAQLTGAARRRNLAGAFRISKRLSPQGKRVLLIDDVFTTGSTVNACAAALKRAGAAHVSVLTVARADRRFAPVGVHAKTFDRTEVETWQT